MGKSKKHNKSKANGKAQNAQKQESSSTTKTLEMKEVNTSQEMHVEGEASQIQPLNTTKEDSKISATTLSDNSSFEKNVEQKKSNTGGNNKAVYRNAQKDSRSFSPNKGSSDFYNKRSEPWKGVKSENVTERRQNYRRDDSDKRTHRDRSKNSRQPTEFEAYENELYKNPKRNYERTIEIEHDLFVMPKEYSLAHCVAEDMNMGSGIAVRFRHQFKKVDELLNQRARTGGLAVLKDGDRFIYYLVTKRLSTGKPTNRTLFASLQKLRQHVIENDVKKLAMPRIGCGLDRLYWDDVKFMIEFIFEKVDVEIKICNLQTEESPQQIKHRNCKLTNETYPIQSIEEGTIIIYLSSEDGFVSEEMKALDEKFHFLIEFELARRRKDNVIFYTKNKDYLLCGCIVKKTELDPVDFSSFQKCIGSIQKENRKYQFGYVGFQAMKDDDDPCFNSKIINILRNSLRDIEVYVCWPGDLQDELLARDRSSDYTPRTSLEQGRDRRSFNQSSGRDSWRNLSPSTSTRNNTAFDSKRGEQDKKLVLSEADWYAEGDSATSAKNESNESRTNVRNTERARVKIDWFGDGNLGDNKDNQADYTRTRNSSWRNHSSTSTRNNTAFDSKRGEQVKKLVLSEADWYADPATSINESNENSTNVRNTERVTVKIDWFGEDNQGNQADSTTTGNKSSAPTDRWDDPDLEDSLSRSKKKPKKNKDPSEYQESDWYANDSQMQISNTDVWLNPDCKPFQPRQRQNIVVHEENPVSNTYKDSWSRKDRSQANSQRDVWTGESQNTTAAVEDGKDSWHVLRSQGHNTKSVFESHEYELYQTEEGIELVTVREREADDLPSRYSRACYVTEDMSLISGIPSGFNLKNCIGDLLSQNKKEGNIAVVKDGSDYVYCLVVKKLAKSTAARHLVFSAIEQMRNHAQKSHVRNIVVSKIDGKTEDTFDWSEVKNMLEFLCRNRNIDIFLVPFKRLQQKSLVHSKSGLHQMKKKSIIIYWASEDGHISDEMNSLRRKFDFVEEFEKTHKRMGNVIKYKQNEDHVLYGCIVKKVYNHDINFRALQQSLIKVNECNDKAEMLKVVGIQAVRDEDESVNFKIINVLMNAIQNITVTVCWPGDLKQKMPK